MLTSELAYVWITSDGRKFLSEKEAKVHETALSVAGSISTWQENKQKQINILNQDIKEKIEWLENQQQNLK